MNTNEKEYDVFEQEQNERYREYMRSQMSISQIKELNRYEEKCKQYIDQKMQELASQQVYVPTFYEQQQQRYTPMSMYPIQYNAPQYNTPNSYGRGYIDDHSFDDGLDIRDSIIMDIMDKTSKRFRNTF